MLSGAGTRVAVQQRRRRPIWRRWRCLLRTSVLPRHTQRRHCRCSSPRLQHMWPRRLWLCRCCPCITAAHAAGSVGAQLPSDSGHMIRSKLCHLHTGRRRGDSTAALPGGSGRQPRLQRGTLQPRVRASSNAAAAAARTSKKFHQAQTFGSKMSISTPSASVKCGPHDIVHQINLFVWLAAWQRGD